MLHDQTLLERVINVFSAMSCIEKVVVVLNANDPYWSTQRFHHPEKILTTLGGKERVDSVLRGLQFLADFSEENDFVLVHDAARPFVCTQDILNLLENVRAHTIGGLLGLPIVDTIKKVDSHDEIEKTVSREQLWIAQTPQCFRYGLLKRAIENALSKNQTVTDESSAVELLGLKPKIILGNPRNIKVTLPGDLVLAT